MKINTVTRLTALAVTLAGLTSDAHADVAESKASAPQTPSIAVYDQGFGLVSEMRRITPAGGENIIRFRRLPARLEPSTVSFIPLVGLPGLDILEQHFFYDPVSPEALLTRYLGRTVEILANGEHHRGRLLHVPRWRGEPNDHDMLLLETDDDGARVFLSPDHVSQVILPDVGRNAYLEPTLQWRVRAEQEGPQNIRLTYRVDDFRWKAAYEVVLDEEGENAYFGGRIGLMNQSGGDYEEASIQLVATERGMLRERRRSAVASPRDPRFTSPPLRYAYGAEEPSFEEATVSLAPVHTYRLDQPVTLRHGDQKFVQYVRVDALPVSRFFVYDGVRFDRFQRQRRNDWNYGTESHSVVETHLQFDNERATGLGIDLPSGQFRLYQRKRDGAVEFIGEDTLLPTTADESGHVLLGPARGLRGERERTSYSEITPLRVYEESFQITVENNTDNAVEIRVVEHLYRWHEYEIVRADAEYEKTGEQTIEFRPTLRPGGRRTIHYTVRYSW